jgi:hypothetical protein
VGAFDHISAFTTGEHWKPAPSAAAGKRSLELPAANTVIVFPAVRE